MGKQKLNNSVNKIYSKCAEIEQDKYWKQFFIDLSHGKCPRSLFLTQNGDLYRYKKSTEIVTIESKTPEEICTIVKSTLPGIGICQNNTNQLEQINATEHTNWNSIKKKGMRDYYILDYCSRLNKDEKYKEYFYNHVNTAMMLGYVKIHFASGKITEISIDYNSKPSRTVSKEYKPSSLLLSNFWRLLKK